MTPIDQEEAWHIEQRKAEARQPLTEKYPLLLSALVAAVIVGGGVAVLWFGWAR